MITHFISIREPYDDWILSGKKTIETRTMRMSPKFLNKTIGIYVPEKKRIVGTIKIVDQVNYPDVESFRADFARHRVAPGSTYDIKPGGKKVGLVISDPVRIAPVVPSGRVYPSMINKNPRPPAAVARVACRGLAKRRKYKRGGTAVGVARGRDLCNRRNVSMRTIRRLSSYFARHRAARAENAKRKKDPTSAAAIADDLWGGSPGWAWAKRVG